MRDNILNEDTLNSSDHIWQILRNEGWTSLRRPPVGFYVAMAEGCMEFSLDHFGIGTKLWNTGDR